MTKLMARFIREDSGQDLIEYGLLIGIITAGAIVFITQIGPLVSQYFQTLQGQLPPPPAPAP